MQLVTIQSNPNPPCRQLSRHESPVCRPAEYSNNSNIAHAKCCIALHCLAFALQPTALIHRTPPPTHTHTHTHTSHHIHTSSSLRPLRAAASANQPPLLPPPPPTSALRSALRLLPPATETRTRCSLLAATTTPCSAITFACSQILPPTLHRPPALASATQHVRRSESLAIARRSTHRQSRR